MIGFFVISFDVIDDFDGGCISFELDSAEEVLGDVMEQIERFI